MSLRYKITGLVFLSLLIFGLLSAFIGQLKMAQALRKEFISKGESIAQGFAKSSVELLIDQDAASIQSFLDGYIEIEGVAYVYILDRYRKVIAHTFVPVFPQGLLEKNPVGEGLDISVRDIQVDGMADVIDIGVPILMGSMGWVHVGMDRGQINREVRGLVKSLWIVYGMGIILTLVIASLLSSQIIRPLRLLTDSTARIASGQFDDKFPLSGGDEVGVLARSFRNMSEKLWISNEEVRAKTLELERQNRELVAMTEELKKTQNHLIQSEKFASMGQLAASVAHEINNPLAGILTFIKLMIRKMDTGQPVKDDIKGYLRNLRIMETETQRCSNIVKNLLDFARVTESKMERVNINEIIRNTMTLTGHRAEMSDIQVVQNLSSLPAVMADAGQLKQVFLNVILNAIEAMQGERKILTIRSMGVDDHDTVAVEIEDTGSGIPQENLPYIFDPFFTTKRKGTGLGLSVVYGIINKHNGRIQVDSKPGEGTTVRIELPAVDAANGDSR
ncbi:MAG: HAMP domain-containing protein [Deltaproteobacteria bacterium]|nr:HAMP domain-containing protein [Deltaproteobacteria bacterium]